jgi:hypothetical protein
MKTDSFCFYLQNRLIQTDQTGGQQYSDTSPFSVPWLLIVWLQRCGVCTHLPPWLMGSQSIFLMGKEWLVARVWKRVRAGAFVAEVALEKNISLTLTKKGVLWPSKRMNQRNQGILKGEKYHCTIDLQFDWFGLVCFTNKNNIFRWTVIYLAKLFVRQLCNLVSTL